MIENKVLLEILRNRFQAIADEMAMVAFRTAHTVFVKETQDYSTCLVSTRGEAFAAPKRYGVSQMVAMPMDDAIRAMGDDVQEGDVFISNDPIGTRGMVTHLPDVYLWKPIFYQGRLICYAWSFIHSSDVGGRVPSSIAPSSYEIYQEGIRIPPRRLIYAGKLDEAFLKVFFANVRIPEQNWGDLKALLSAINTGERRVHALLDQFGGDVIVDGIESVLDYAEMQARRIIRRVPDGVYTYVDYMEGDKLGLGMVRIKLSLHIRGDEMIFDYSGTDPQVRASLNLYTFSKDGHWNLLFGLTNWLVTMEPGIAFNGGLVRQFKMRIPSGTLLNAEFGAACGNRSATQIRMTDVNFGALAQAVPYDLPGFCCGQASILVVSVPDFKTGATKVSVLQPLAGGSGGRPHEDGIDGVDTIWGFLRNVPTEATENDLPPVLITRYGLRPDSGGPGQYRGGNGVVIEFMTTSPYTVITSRAMDRYIFPPPGRLGGGPGATGYTRLNPGTSREQDIGKVDVLELAPGDLLQLGTQGGGGFGDPLDRPVDATVEDVRNGLVSPELALKAYGVVVDARGVLDAEATKRERQARLSERPSKPPTFTFGPVRDAYRKQWPIELEDAVAMAAADRPVVLRQFLHQRLKGVITERLAQGERVEAGDVPAILAKVSSRIGSGYPQPRQQAHT